MIRRHTYGAFTAALVALASYTIPASAAEPCDGITEAGLCDDATTLVYCAAGSLVRLECPAGERCVTDDPRFEGAAGCVAASLAGCGDLDESGACDSDDTVVFCDAREVRQRRCPEGTKCGWVEDEGWFDCVSNHLSSTDRFVETEAPNGPDDGEPEEPTQPDAEPSGPATADPGEAQAPSVTTGGAPAAGEFEAAGSGCASANTEAGLIAIVFVAMVALRRRFTSAG